MYRNNKGIAPLYIVIIVLAVIATALGIYFYLQSQERKTNIAKIEKLDKELQDLVDVDNFVTVSNGEAIPRTQSDINSTLEKIEDNISEYDDLLKLVVKDNMDISCIVSRGTSLKSRFVDDTKRTLLGSGSASSQYNKNYWYRNFDDNRTYWMTEFKRSCEKIYKDNGIEFND